MKQFKCKSRKSNWNRFILMYWFNWVDIPQAIKNESNFLQAIIESLSTLVFINFCIKIFSLFYFSVYLNFEYKSLNLYWTHQCFSTLVTFCWIEDCLFSSFEFLLPKVASFQSIQHIFNPWPCDFELEIDLPEIIPKVQ